MKKDDDLVRTREGMYGRSMHAQHSDSDRRIMDTPGPSLRVFQVWKGNNVGYRSLFIFCRLGFSSVKISKLGFGV